MLKQVLFFYSLILFLPLCVPAQQKDSVFLINDSVANNISVDSTARKDSLQAQTSGKADTVVVALKQLLADNIYLNTKSKPFVFIQSSRKVDSKDSLFYSLTGVVFLFALLKFIYTRYFNNLFRVFFNTSLRQSQLTDQLLQAKLPSLLFNIFFILIGGCYLFMLLNIFGRINHFNSWQALLLCAASLIGIYLSKFIILKFTGWITGYKQEADTYIFIVFMINKIVGICLIPLVIVMAFSDKTIVDIALILSFVVIGLMLLMRFFRSYSLLQNRMKVSRFHFFIYILGIEIVPLLVIYKAALLFMSKNL